MPMMAITTRSSTRVKPLARRPVDRISAIMFAWDELLDALSLYTRIGVNLKHNASCPLGGTP
jgi:hypothetical protein